MNRRQSASVWFQPAMVLSRIANEMSAAVRFRSWSAELDMANCLAGLRLSGCRRRGRSGLRLWRGLGFCGHCLLPGLGGYILALQIRDATATFNDFVVLLTHVCLPLCGRVCVRNRCSLQVNSLCTGDF